jgi:cyclopropane fatty-acyl-phospholipid synthase-like methyltransferase
MIDDFFYEIFSDMPRLAPGSDSLTKLALSKIEVKDSNLVLDLGCGIGSQSLILAESIPGKIICLDNYEPFLDKIKNSSTQNSAAAQIETSLQDMNDISFENEFFDLIWAEGSLYVLGIGKGLQKLYSLLKPGGFAVFSDLNFTEYDIPEELTSFFNLEYPDMMHYKETIKEINESSFNLRDWFAADYAAHWDNYWKPLEERVERYYKIFESDSAKTEILDSLQREVDIFKKYSAYFGYHFYILEKE